MSSSSAPSSPSPPLSSPLSPLPLLFLSSVAVCRASERRPAMISSTSAASPRAILPSSLMASASSVDTVRNDWALTRASSSFFSPKGTLRLRLGEVVAAMKLRTTPPLRSISFITASVSFLISSSFLATACCAVWAATRSFCSIQLSTCLPCLFSLSLLSLPPPSFPLSPPPSWDDSALFSFVSFFIALCIASSLSCLAQFSSSHFLLISSPASSARCALISALMRLWLASRTREVASSAALSALSFHFSTSICISATCCFSSLVSLISVRTLDCPTSLPSSPFPSPLPSSPSSPPPSSPVWAVPSPPVFSPSTPASAFFSFSFTSFRLASSFLFVSFSLLPSIFTSST
mmetsp:Transcript_43117/g.111755  ORF Transcript_43117/g.111755 Transcript_43117/m.111755 type:complete len:349 (-) Transcript_43117:1174-2220(-)